MKFNTQQGTLGGSINMSRTLIFMAILALAAPGVLAQPSTDCAAVATSSPEQASGAFTTSFSALAILDVDATAMLSNATFVQLSRGSHVLDFQFFTPRGNLYQSMSLPISSDKGRIGKPQQVAGYPQPLTVAKPERVEFNRRSYYGASVRLPVAGTTIVANSLYGSWTVRVDLDGKPLPCSPATSFIIRQ
jgi:hypothetical protein